jgi:Fic family protein
MMIKYELPDRWIKYKIPLVIPDLVEAKAAVLSLISVPYQRSWAEELQKIQLKREVAGTSRIEGADFTDLELEEALKPNSSPVDFITRSQRQAYAAVETYRWIAALPNDRPIDEELIKDTHRRIVSGCDEDHCPPGIIRESGCNVIFGVPPHRGCEGGKDCQEAFDKLMIAIQSEFKAHDQLIQALAVHYHFAAMHPFLDGNGRSARALEALFLQRAGLRDTTFIAMSNYYYDEKNAYLGSLSAVRAEDHDLTPFLVFGLRGITIQCQRLSAAIRKNLEKAVFRNLMYDLFNRLETTRKRVIKDRQIEILKLLLEVDSIDWHQMVTKIRPYYGKLKNYGKTLIRDVSSLSELGAIKIQKVQENQWTISLRLTWPSEITETEFFKIIKNLPKGKTYTFLR